MKDIKPLLLAYSSLLIILLAQCSKAPTASSCKVCSPNCVIGHFTYPGGGTSTQTYCGNAAYLSYTEASASTALIQSGGSVYFTSTTPNPSNNFNVCGAGSSINDSVAYYTALGYTCQ